SLVSVSHHRGAVRQAGSLGSAIENAIRKPCSARGAAEFARTCRAQSRYCANRPRPAPYLLVQAQAAVPSGAIKRLRPTTPVFIENTVQKQWTGVSCAYRPPTTSRNIRRTCHPGSPLRLRSWLAFWPSLARRFRPCPATGGAFGIVRPDSPPPDRAGGPPTAYVF